MFSSLSKVALVVALLAFPGCTASVPIPPPPGNAPASKPEDPLAQYKVNIGKNAYNDSNGVWRGKIVGVGYWQSAEMKTPVVVYKVDRGDGKLINAPVNGCDIR